jgi:BASS family bile acid:Na+ symporter
MRDLVVPLVRVLARIAVPLVAFAVGIDAAPADVAWLWRRPGLLLRSLFVLFLAVPIVAVVLARVLPLAPAVWVGLVISALSVGPVAALRRARAFDADDNYALSLNVTLLLAGIPFLPLAFALVGALFGHRVSIGVGSIAGVILLLQLLPLVLGLAVARRWPTLAGRLRKPVTWVGNGLLLVVVLVALVVLARPMLQIGGTGFLAMGLLALASVALGHLFGGPDDGSRLVLASFGALRFPALSLLLASTIREGRRVVPVVLAYFLVTVLVLALYRVVLRGVSARRSRGVGTFVPSLTKEVT